MLRRKSPAPQLRRKNFEVVLISLLMIPIAGCGFEASKKAAESTANRFYDAVSTEQWDRAVAVYSPAKDARPERLIETLQLIRDKLGKYDHRQLIGAKHREDYVAGGESRQLTTLIYRVQYEKGETTETISFFGIPDANSEMKFSGYEVQSPVFQSESE
jgi:hypothetical protein